MNTEEMLKLYEKGLSTKGQSRAAYVSKARDFLEYTDGKIDRETIDRYMEYLRKRKKFGDGTVNLIFRIIRTMVGRVNKVDQSVEWPYRRGESPQIHESDVDAPALHPELVEEMIREVKKEGDVEEKALFALSTTYGLRRTELMNITADDISIRDRIIHIATAKHGRERSHIIPEEIVPYLQGYDFSKPRLQRTILCAWYRIEARAGINHTDRVGWHSIRRTLDTLLLDRHPENTVKNFMRWASSEMTAKYTAISFVGKEGKQKRVVGQAADIDNKIFADHPFVPVWGEA